MLKYKCDECDRVFDLTADDDPYAYGHDCEALPTEYKGEADMKKPSDIQIDEIQYHRDRAEWLIDQVIELRKELTRIMFEIAKWEKYQK